MQTIKYLIKFAFFPRKVRKEMLEEIYARNIILIVAIVFTLIMSVEFYIEKYREAGIVIFTAGLAFLFIYLYSFISGAFVYFIDKISAKKIATFRECYKMALITVAVPLSSVIFKLILQLCGLTMAGWVKNIFDLCVNVYGLILHLHYLKKFYEYDKRDIVIVACIRAILLL